MRFQPSTLKQASIPRPFLPALVSLPWSTPMSSLSLAAGSKPSSLSTCSSHHPHSPLEADSFSSVLHPPHDHRELPWGRPSSQHMENSFFLLCWLFLWWVHLPILWEHTRVRCCGFPLGPWLPPPPHVPELELAAASLSTAGTRIASSAWLIRASPCRPPCLPSPPAKIPKPVDLSEPARAQLQLHCLSLENQIDSLAPQPSQWCTPEPEEENCQIDSHLREDLPTHHLSLQQSWAVNGPESSGNTIVTPPRPTYLKPQPWHYTLYPSSLIQGHIQYEILSQQEFELFMLYHLIFAKAKWNLKEIEYSFGWETGNT